MANKLQKIRVGVFTAITAALVTVVIVVFGGMRFWEDRPSYYIVFDGSVMGLEHGAQVYMNGIRVGSVQEIAPAPDDLRKVRVTIEVSQKAQVRRDTEATLQFAGITGLKVIDLRNGTLGAQPLPSGSTIAVGQTILDKFEDQAKTLVAQSTELMTRANLIVKNLEEITRPGQFEGVAEIVKQAKVTTDNLAAMSGSLNAMVGENRAALRQTIASVDATAKSATAMLEGKVAVVVAGAGDFVGQLRGLVTGNETQLRSAVFDLRQAARSFKELAREVRQRPSRLLFSSAPSERELP